MTLEFKVYGNPVGKARPCFVGRTKQAYTPKKTKGYEEFVKWCYKEACGEKVLAGEISAIITAYYKIPKSWSKKRKEQAINGEIKPTVKPDCDNVAKAILDALNGVAYVDDAAVTDLELHKRYVIDSPYVEVIITNNH